MATAYVTATRLNVRTEPRVRSGNRMGYLEMGDRVTIVEEAPNAGWVLVKARGNWINSGPAERRGFVSERYLRVERVVPTAGQRYVTALTLNVRSEPRVASSTRIGTLRMAAPVDYIEPAGVGDWVKIEAEADWLTRGPTRRTAYVSNKFLRNPEAQPIEDLVGAAFEQWKRFKWGSGREDRYPYYRYVGEMWDSIDLDFDGRDRSIPWSAAAISFMVKQAGGPYAGVKSASGHWKFINDAISDRENGRTSRSPFWGRIRERKPEVGDLIGKWRVRRMTYSRAYQLSQERSESRQSYTSHTDVVIAVVGRTAHTLGGNVGNTLGRTTWPLDSSGYLAGSKNEFVLLKNRTG